MFRNTLTQPFSNILSENCKSKDRSPEPEKTFRYGVLQKKKCGKMQQINQVLLCTANRILLT